MACLIIKTSCLRNELVLLDLGRLKLIIMVEESAAMAIKEGREPGDNNQYNNVAYAYLGRSY